MGLSGWGVFLILLVVVVVFGGAGYILYSHYRARRLGLPPPPWNPFAYRSRRGGGDNYRAPAPAPGGIQGWIADKFHGLRNSAGGGGGGGRSMERDRRGFGPLDPDEAWSAHVDHEGPSGYYEEQELGDPGQGPYGGGGYGEVDGFGRGRNRSRQRELDQRYDEEVHGGGGAGLNPFEHAEESSLRAVSPRPHVDTKTHRKGNASLNTNGSAETSPTERRSMFHEDV